MADYRINYGNGQTSWPVDSLEKAQRALAALKNPDAFIEEFFFGGGSHTDSRWDRCLEVTYRINYGNGQVSKSFESLRVAKRELEALNDPFAFLQFYDPGDSESPGDWWRWKGDR